MTIRLFTGVVAVLLATSIDSAAADRTPLPREDGLVILRWDGAADPGPLVEGRLRYVAPGLLVIRGGAREREQLEGDGFEVLLSDAPAAGEDYFITDHLHGRSPPGVVVVHTAAGGWSLVRVELARFWSVQEQLLFLWPLPDHYDARSMKPPATAKPVARDPAPDVIDLIAGVDEAELQRHVESLALIETARGSVEGNIRTRFAFRPEMVQSTTYIRDELHSSLGEGAVELQEFPGRPGRVTSRIDSFDAEVDAIPLYNVVGELQGSDPDAGYYIVCAHYDAIGTRSSGGWNWRTDVAPGADDNATGVALVLESARILSKRQFPWSVRFIAWSGEELGLWGSQHFADLARDREDRILGVLNFDMIGFNDLNQRLELVTNPASAWLVQLMNETNERYDIGLQVDVLQDSSAWLSDHAPFWHRGYDAILGIENYLPTDNQTPGVLDGDYRLNSQYHSIVDLPDSVNWELVGRVTRLAVASLAQFGREEDLPNLVVFTGDISGDRRDDLLIRVGNIGPVPLTEPYQLVVSRCEPDSSACIPFFETVREGGIPAGGVDHVTVEWRRYGESVFHVSVDHQELVDEIADNDNDTFQLMRLVPQNNIVVFPNPFDPGEHQFLSFSGLPRYSKLRITTLDGQLVWSASDSDSEQKNLWREIRWRGSNDSGFAVGNGLYLYSIHSKFSGELLHRNKIAVVR